MYRILLVLKNINSCLQIEDEQVEDIVPKDVSIMWYSPTLRCYRSWYHASKTETKTSAVRYVSAYFPCVQIKYNPGLYFKLIWENMHTHTHTHAFTRKHTHDLTHTHEHTHINTHTHS